MKSGLTVKDFRQTVELNATRKHDIIVPAHQLHMGVLETNSGRPSVAIVAPNASEPMPLTEVGHEQLASLTQVPRQYYNRLLATHPELLARNVNTALADLPKDYNRQVRTLDGNVRAILSPTFQPFDNVGLINYILPMFYEDQNKRTLISGDIIPALRDSSGNFLQAKVRSCNVTDRYASIKITVPALRADVRVGQTIHIGCIIRNSEVGLAMLEVLFFWEVLQCTNGASTTRSYGGFSRRHVGSRQALTQLNSGVNAINLLERRRIERLQFLEMGDTIRETLNELALSKILEPMQAATQVRVKSPDAAISLLGRKFGVTEQEQRGVLGHLLSGTATGTGEIDDSVWGLQAAFTRYSQDVTNYDRATELEGVGGKIIDLGPKEWRVLAEVEPKKDKKNGVDLMSELAEMALA